MKRITDWLRGMYRWVESFAEKPHALWALFLIAFAESSFFPIPPDVLVIALAVSFPSKSLKFALVCTAGSVLGGVFGYYIGYALMESIGHPIIDMYNAQHYWLRVEEAYRSELGVWFLVAAAFTPIPYKVATIAAGATQMPFLPFVIASALGRAGRFFLVAGLIWKFGPSIKTFIDKYFDKLSIAFILLLVLGFIAVKYVF
ncbi:MAG: cytochrome B [Ectothiorhodospiraceae bacterium]|nr:cytochrome B [Ectothiorhodospiraceae bacterium]